MRANRRSWLLFILVTALAANVAAVAGTVAFKSAPVDREIKACVLGGNSRIFYNLSRSPQCPEGWSFTNPQAPADETPTGTAGYVALPSDMAYWTVNLADTSSLEDMDVIYAQAANITDPVLQGILIKAVENGALLWLEGATTGLQPPRVTPVGGAGAPPNPQPFLIEATAGAPQLRTPAVPGSELLNVPNRLNATEISQLGTLSNRVTWPHTDGGGWTHQTDVEFRPVIELRDAGGASLGFSVMVASYGNGAILVCADNIGGQVASWGTSLEPAPTTTAAHRFAFNAISWLFRCRQRGPGGQGSGSPVTRAPVAINWQYPAPNRLPPPGGPLPQLGPVVGAPAVANGRIYVLSTLVTGGAARLVCLDAEPEQDLCGPLVAGVPGLLPDGEADDGIVDYSLGAQYDVIWEYVIPGGLSPKSSSVVVADRWNDDGDGVREPGEIRPVVLFSLSSPNPGNGAGGIVRCLFADTGSLVWDFTVAPYNGASRVCDVSTPVVNNGHVFFVASEYSGGLPDGTGVGVDRTYGRAWCIDLFRGGVLNANLAQSGAVWVFPDSDLDRTGPQLYAEPQRSLPCFNDPIWVNAVGTGVGTELPPTPTVTPVVTSGASLDDGTLMDALMIVGTPVTNTWIAGQGIRTLNWIVSQSRAGGSEYALAPTPTRGTGAASVGYDTINREYYSVLLNAPAPSTWNSAERFDDFANAVPLQVPYDTAFPTDAAHFNPVNTTSSGVRQCIARWYAAPMLDENPYELLKGFVVDLERAGDHETYFLRGPIVWQRQYRWNEVRIAGGVARNGRLYAPTVPPISYPPNYPPVLPPAPFDRRSSIGVIETATGALSTRLSPNCALPADGDTSAFGVGVRTAVPMMLAAPAEDDGVLATAVSQWKQTGGAGVVAPTRSALVGLRRASDLEIRLGPAVDDGIAIRKGTPNVIMRLFDCEDLASVGSIPPYAYSVNHDTRTLRIDPQYADDVGVIDDMTGPSAPRDAFVNPIAGKVVLVRWYDTAGNAHPSAASWEMHRFAPGHHFTYVPGFAKLNNCPADLGTVAIRLPSNSPLFTDGVPVSGFVAGEPTVSFDYGAGNRDLLPNGWLDMTGAFADVNGDGTRDTEDWYLDAGTEVAISYRGFYEPAVGWTPGAAIPAMYDDVNGFVYVPNPGLGFAAERQQIPVGFGPSYSPPALAGKTFLLGTQGMTEAPGGGLPPSGAGPFEYYWNNAFATAAGAISPSETLLAGNWDPVTKTASGRLVEPADDDAGNVPVVTAPITISGDTAIVGSRTMSAPDTYTGNGYISTLSTERTAIAAGSRIVECVGGEPVRTLTGSRSQGGVDVWPFGHIAKVTRLQNGNLLVVDSGNNQVLELDSLGCRVWFAGSGRNEAKLFLQRPTDAWRYYAMSEFGRMDEEHTVIADAGNRRIVEIVRKPATAGAPPTVEEAYIVSPNAVPVDAAGRVCEYNQAEGFAELEYQKAQPILDPATNELWGYLTCAANHNYPLIVEPPRWDTAGNFYKARANPTGVALGAHIGNPPYLADGSFDATQLPSLATLGRNWQPWTFLYPLEFRNIRQVEYATYGNALFGDAELNAFVWVVASRYQPMPAAPMGVYEFQMGPAPALSYAFTRAEYVASPMSSIPLPASGGPAAFTKTYFPTSAKRLNNGDYVIANLAGAPEHLTAQNTDWSSWGRSLGSEVFRVVSETNSLYGRNMIPDPRSPAWAEPLGMVSYAERF